MPGRVGSAFEKSSPTRSDTTLSESEGSFVSAQSENTSGKSHKRSLDSHNNQSLSTPRYAALSTSDDDPTTPSAQEQATPLARKLALLSPISLLRSTRIPKSADSYFAPQEGTSSIEPWSPGNRRAPASRSSHGIETRSGPPPALSTQRSQNADLPWRTPTPSETAGPQSSQKDQNGGIRSVLKSEKRLFRVGASRIDKRADIVTPVPDPMARKQKESGTPDDDEDPTLRMNDLVRRDDQKSEGQHPQQEDLFLNLARADSVVDDGSDTVSRFEKKRSRQGNSASMSSRPSSAGRPSTIGGRLFGYQTSIGQNPASPQKASFDTSVTKSSLSSLRDGNSADRAYAASAHPLDQRRRARYSGSSAKPFTPSSQLDKNKTIATYGRRRSIHPPVQKNYYSSPIQERRRTIHGDDMPPSIPQGDGTESTVSTTAPSTVWDELDDLKSRIRKIELTGHLPSTSNAAMSTISRERPTTATTTTTTMSLSPKRLPRPNASPETPTIQEQSNPATHHLLQSALAETKSRINPLLYRALEASVTDALGLSAMTGAKSTQGASAGQGNAISVVRQMRRKADSLCRSLTELCIALAESSADAESPIRVHQEKAISPITVSKRAEDPRKVAIDDPEFRASSRVMSRLEARRSSMMGSSNLGQQSPQESPQPEASATTPTQDRRPLLLELDRASSVIRRRDDDNASSVSRRSSSRAATEVGSHRPSPQTRISREYTSQHPMPSPPPGSTSVQYSQPTRKSYFQSPSAPSPNTPIVKPGNRRYLDRSTPLSADSARLAEARQRRLASLGQGSSPGALRAGSSSGKLSTVESDKG